MGRRPRTDIDWDAVERDWRTGHMSIREIGKRHNISHTVVRDRSITYGWVRDLGAKIRQGIAIKVSSLPSSPAPTVRTPEEQAELEALAVEQAASRGADVVLRHQKILSYLEAAGTSLDTNCMSLVESAQTLP